MLAGLSRILKMIKDWVLSGSQPQSFSSRQLLSLNPKLSKYSIGRFSYSYSVPDVVEGTPNLATLRIGSFCSIANNVTIFLDGEHRTDWVTTYPFNLILDDFKSIKGHPKTKGSVIIGNDVWIGMNAMILSGVTIGDGAVIWANSVVSKDVAPYTIVAGNPARVIRQRFDQETNRQATQNQVVELGHPTNQR